MSDPKFQIYKGNDEQFYFRLRARNGEVILASEGYSSEAGCQNGIESVKENAVRDERFQRKVSDNNQFYFVLVASNGEPIGNSEMYSSESARESGIEAVNREAPEAMIEIETWLNNWVKVLVLLPK